MTQSLLSDDCVALGQRFREVRRLKKVPQADLARALKCSVNTIRWHEAGLRMMRLNTVVQASIVLGVSPCELIETEST